VDDVTDGTAAFPAPRVLSAWEQRLFEGVRMVDPAEQAELAASPRYQPAVGGRRDSEDSRWYGQRLSGTDGSSQTEVGT
jgi:hypothetical protein